MKIILSRKGFDSGKASGCFPSPILPNGQIISFPIPSSKSDLSWDDIETRDIDLKELISDLLPPDYLNKTLHLDPDLNRKKEKRTKDWRPALGQVKAAAGHLINQNVGKNDLFLFFGWFRHIKRNSQTKKWEYYGPDFHALFGWLEIENLIDVKEMKELEAYPFLSIHPHYYPAKNEEHNLIFIAKERSDFVLNSFGGGMLNKFSSDLILTKLGHPRSIWSLPKCLDARENPEQALSYHRNLTRWGDDTDNPDKVILKTVARGQEFVLDTAYFPEVKDWAINLIKNHI
ncbi:Nmad3 family putative nucleotide modification protein [Ursidibacter sp. B-7004-1]